jgi:hypothetical protein
MEQEFQKAVKSRIKRSIVYAAFCGYLSILFLYSGYSFFNIDFDFVLINGIIGILFLVGSLMSIMDIIKFKYNKKISEEYSLCKRCKRLIKKDKVFCDECKNRIRRLNKYEEDKNFIKEYALLIKQENKEKK